MDLFPNGLGKAHMKETLDFSDDSVGANDIPDLFTVRSSMSR